MAVSSYHSFESGAQLAEELSDNVAEHLNQSISEFGSARFAVSGGSTPLQFFDFLSKEIIDWSRVTVTLVDERCVPTDHERSNERLVKTTLLRNAASDAHYESIVFLSDHPSVTFRPSDVLILGIGKDGHTASLFPGGDNLEEALSTDTRSKYATMSAPSAPEPRITMTLPAIVSARNLYLHIEGQEKADVFERALSDPELPIHHIARHPDARLNVYWAP